MVADNERQNLVPVSTTLGKAGTMSLKKCFGALTKKKHGLCIYDNISPKHSNIYCPSVAEDIAHCCLFVHLFIVFDMS